MKMNVPTVSVVMPVYNERPYLEESIRSVLNQSFDDFEFIIVNDGSTDGSKDVMERFSDEDQRIRVFHQENQGIGTSRNRGLRLAHGKYIAVMDGDDVTHTDRFERQVRFLDENPEIGVVGTKSKYIDSEGNPHPWGHWPIPTTPEVIAWRLMFNTCLVHPSVMMRHSLIEKLGGYAEWATPAEDYELWTRAVREMRLANLPGTLHELRRHEGSVTVSHREQQIQNCVEAAIRLHRDILGSSADKQIVQFLVWMETRGIEEAIDRAGAVDLSAVHAHMQSLYEVHRDHFPLKEQSVRARRNALAQLDVVANKITEHNGWGSGTLPRMSSRLMAPSAELLPWLWRAVRERIA
jgi:glycosyltransferase involved in cell wall biosynthesis